MTPSDQSAPISKTARWIGWILTVLPVLLLVMSGVMKLLKPAPVVEGFTKFGYPATLLVPLGMVEIVCALLYLVPRTSLLGAILVTGYLGGATATLVRVGDPTFPAPVLLGVMAWGGLYLRDPRIRAAFCSLLGCDD